jgi:hypothetical protein
MPCFGLNQAYAEGVVIGRLLAGYGELEVSMCACLIAVEGTFDPPVRTLFEKRGEKKRIDNAKQALSAEFAKANLLMELTETLDDMDWCREIRNQYSHCQWYWTSHEGLCFVNLEEAANQPAMILALTEDKHPINVALLEKQEEFFWYVKQCFMSLEDAYKTWDRRQAQKPVRSQDYPRPLKLARPPAHN